MFIDTNVYSALNRGNKNVIELLGGSSELSLPLPVLAELRYGFAKGDQPEQNERILQKFLAQPQVSMALPTAKTTEHYAALQLLCAQRGKALSQNDVWIAALAYEASQNLVTFDQDFKVLAEIFDDKLIVLN